MLVPTHTPAPLQVSPVVQALLSLHVPVLGGCVQAPAESHISVVQSLASVPGALQPHAPLPAHVVPGGHAFFACPSATPAPFPSAQLPPVSRNRLRLPLLGGRRALIDREAAVATKWAGSSARSKRSSARATPLEVIPTHISWDLP